MSKGTPVQAPRRDLAYPCRRAVGRGVLVAGLLAVSHAAPAHADLKLCNASDSRVGIAVGYQDAKGWATEGWWNIGSQACETLLKGAVPSRFIYIYAVDYDRGGEWAGSNFMCTHDKSFAIRDVRDCQRRGYRRTGFFEVDTGEAKDWTIRLTDPEDAGEKAK
ncbi:MAG: DUF1036 domain-containing protein [Hyphomicrobiaceae bacterium]|nr:DUF1036 domain-containing protein [Hyphomicrobiaceae bacterium]